MSNFNPSLTNVQVNGDCNDATTSLPPIEPITTKHTFVSDPQHPHRNPEEVTALEVTVERLENGEIPNLVIKYGFPYLLVATQKQGVNEFGESVRTSTEHILHFLHLGDFVVIEPPQGPNSVPEVYALDPETFQLNFAAIPGRPDHYRAITEEAKFTTHSSHRLDDVSCLSYAIS